MVHRSGRRWVLGAVILIVAGVVIAACGGGQSTATPPRAAPTSTPQALATTPATTPSQTAQDPGAPVPTSTAAPATPTRQAAQPKYGGMILMRSSSPNLARPGDTYRTDQAFSALVLQNLLNNLMFLDIKNPKVIHPDLAERWAVAQDGRSVTFFLRRGVQWSDGTPFGAADVKFNLERGAFPTAPQATQNKAALAALDRVEVLDDYTVQAVLKRPSASFVVNISTPFMLMYPARIPDPDQWGGKLVTGPFKLQEYRAGVSMTVERNPNYFKKDEEGRQLPFLDGVQTFVIPEQAAVLAAFRAGRLNCACGYATDILVPQAETIRESVPGVKLATPSSLDVQLFFSSKPPLDDVRVRRALSLSLDRREVNSVFRGGKGFYPSGYLRVPGLNGQWALPAAEILTLPGWREPKKADLDEARQLFAQAGINPSDFEFELISPAPSYTDLGEVVSSALINAGLKIRYSPLTTDASNRVYGQNNFHMGLQPGGGAVDDPSDLLLSFVLPGGGRNYGKYEDAEITRLADAQEAALDPAQRRELLYQLQRRLYTLAWVVPVINVAALYGAWPYVENIELERAFGVTSFHRMERVWMST